MISRLKGHAVPVSDNPDEDVRLNSQESAEAIVSASWERRAEP